LTLVLIFIVFLLSSLTRYARMTRKTRKIVMHIIRVVSSEEKVTPAQVYFPRAGRRGSVQQKPLGSAWHAENPQESLCFHSGEIGWCLGYGPALEGGLKGNLGRFFRKNQPAGARGLLPASLASTLFQVCPSHLRRAPRLIMIPPALTFVLIFMASSFGSRRIGEVIDQSSQSLKIRTCPRFLRN